MIGLRQLSNNPDRYHLIKSSYLNSDFALTFPTVDITSVLKRLVVGHCGSRASCHIKVDLGDYDY